MFSFLALVLVFAAPALAQEPRLETPRTWQQPEPVAAYTGAVTVAFWNLEWFPGGQSSRQFLPPEYVSNHIAAVAEVVDREDPVIFIACEVRTLPDALALNRALKRPYPYVAVTDYGDENTRPTDGKETLQEHAMFSRIPWVETWELDFGAMPVTPTRPARGFISALFSIGGEPLTVYGVHPKANYIRPGDKNPELTSLRNVEKREAATRLLLADLQRRNLDPLKDKIIIAGDFNTDLYAERFQGEKTIKAILQAGFFDSFAGVDPAARITIPAQTDDAGRSYPDTTFDYILTSVGLGQLKATVIKGGQSKENPGGPGAPGHSSDHYMVKVTLPKL